MAQAVRLVIAVVIGFVAGSAVNMSLIMIGGKVIPPPSGADVTTLEGLRESIHLFQPRHFLFPFLAHALGTFVGAYVAAVLTPTRRPLPPLIVGGLFLLGGVANILMLPGPAWFNSIDLVFAYLPCAWFAYRLASRSSGSHQQVGQSQ